MKAGDYFLYIINFRFFKLFYNNMIMIKWLTFIWFYIYFLIFTKNKSQICNYFQILLQLPVEVIFLV